MRKRETRNVKTLAEIRINNRISATNTNPGTILTTKIQHYVLKFYFGNCSIAQKKGPACQCTGSTQASLGGLTVTVQALTLPALTID